MAWVVLSHLLGPTTSYHWFLLKAHLAKVTIGHQSQVWNMAPKRALKGWDVTPVPFWDFFSFYTPWKESWLHGRHHLCEYFGFYGPNERGHAIHLQMLSQPLETCSALASTEGSSGEPGEPGQVLMAGKGEPKADQKETLKG